MMNKNEKGEARKSLRLDIIFIAALLVISSAALLLTRIFRKEGNVAVVSVGPEEVARYSLAEDGEYEINGGTNILVIENGEAYMKFSTCVGYQDCVEKGRIRYAGEFITCLPNGVSVVIEGDDAGDAPELIS